MTNTSHNIECACKECRKIKGPMVNIGSSPHIEHYELARFRKDDKSIYYKYKKRKMCPFCNKGYIIKTKSFSRCVRCSKDVE